MHKELKGHASIPHQTLLRKRTVPGIVSSGRERIRSGKHAPLSSKLIEFIFFLFFSFFQPSVSAPTASYSMRLPLGINAPSLLPLSAPITPSTCWIALLSPQQSARTGSVLRRLLWRRWNPLVWIWLKWLRLGLTTPPMVTPVLRSCKSECIYPSSRKGRRGPRSGGSAASLTS